MYSWSLRLLHNHTWILHLFGQWWFNVKHRNSFRLQCWLVSEGSVLAAACFASGPRDYLLLSGVKGSAAQRLTESFLNVAGVTFLVHSFYLLWGSRF